MGCCAAGGAGVRRGGPGAVAAAAGGRGAAVGGRRRLPAPLARRVPSGRSSSRVGVCRPPEAPRGAEVARHPPGRRASVPVARPASGERRAAAGPPPGGRRAAAARLRLTRRARLLAASWRWRSGSRSAPGSGRCSAGADGDLRLAGVQSVVVQPGDTLWSIAATVAGDGDVRDGRRPDPASSTGSRAPCSSPARSSSCRDDQGGCRATCRGRARLDAAATPCRDATPRQEIHNVGADFVNPQCGRVHALWSLERLRSSRVRRHGEPSSGVHQSAPGRRGLSGRCLVGRRAARLAARLRRLLPGVGAGRPRRRRGDGVDRPDDAAPPGAAPRPWPPPLPTVASADPGDVGGPPPVRSSRPVRRRGRRGHGEPAEGPRAVRRPGRSRPGGRRTRRRDGAVRVRRPSPRAGDRGDAGAGRRRGARDRRVRRRPDVAALRRAPSPRPRPRARRRAAPRSRRRRHRPGSGGRRGSAAATRDRRGRRRRAALDRPRGPRGANC